MKTHSIPLCCGSVILTDFGHTGCTMGTGAEIDKKAISAYLKQQKGYYKRLSFIQAILNRQQHEAIGDVFVEEGFKDCGRAVNIAHNDYLHIYILFNEAEPKEGSQWDDDDEEAGW